MPFLDSLDIANRSLQLCGVNKILTVSEDSPNNNEISAAYDKLRRPELRRNYWRFSIRKTVLRAIDATTLLLNPTFYSSTATYLAGAVVQDINGQHWISLIPDNVNFTPGGNNEAWDAYYGPLSVTLWDSKVSYFAGELVYKAGGVAGSYQVYMSLKSTNIDPPDVATAWDVATTYYADQVVSNGGSNWRNLLPLNVGITPFDAPGIWLAATSYSIGNQVTASNHKIYTSATNGNVGHDPVTDGGTNWTDTNTYAGWSRSPTLTTAAISWLPLGNTALKNLSVPYPIGSGPSTEVRTRNAFYLPAGFLRKAPRDPKAGSVSALGAPSGLDYDDWTIEGKFIVSSQTNPLVLRFVADISVVRDMDDMFCEGLACRIAAAVCERLTQSTEKLQTIASEYKMFMGEARLVNAIETGAEEPAVDDYIQCRA